MRTAGRNEVVKHPVTMVLLFLLTVYLAACSAPTAPSPTATSAPAGEEAEETVLHFEVDYVLLTPEELRTQADLIFAGTVQAISPTRWNQDSGEYWTEATVDGESTFSASPVYEITLSVDRPVVDNIGIGQEVVLTLSPGKSPADADTQKANDGIYLEADTVDVQVGQELLVFAGQIEIAWRDPSRPIEEITQPDGTKYFEIGRRSVITLLGLPSNSYLVKGDDGLYHPAPGAMNQEEPISLESLLQELSGEPMATVPAENEFINLRKLIGEQNVVLYTAQEQGTFSLLSWPELPALARPEFAAAYGERIGHMYGDDLAPQLSPSGQYLIVPKVDWQAGVPASPEDSTTWIVDLQSGAIQEIAQRPLFAVWEPDEDRLAFVKDDTLYVQAATEQGGTPLFTQPGLGFQFFYWSPDGQQIAVISTEIGESIDGAYPPITDTLRLIDAENGEQRPLQTFSILPIAHNRREFQWSVDGTAIFVGLALPGRIYSLTGETIFLEEGDRGLGWGYDASQFILSNEDGLFVMNPQNQQTIQIDNHASPITAWSVSQDRTHLAYARNRQIYVVDLVNGFQRVALLTRVDKISSLHWSTTGDFLIFDNGDWNTPIWAISVADEQIGVLVQDGVLLNVIPVPE